MNETIQLEAIVPESLAGKRLDQILAELFPDYSRSRMKKWITEGKVSVDAQVIEKPREKLELGALVAIDAELEREERYQAQPIELDIVYEDDDILIINKPAGLVVHPGAGAPDGTLLNGLLHYDPDIDHVPRAGIIHRLDKDTTGLMVVARNIPAQTQLVDMMQKREITREYEAVCNGVMTAGGMVDEPIGRHPTKRTHMAVVSTGKPAVTHYRVMERFRAHTLLRLRLESGRTHQIRVHMSHIRHPLVGDLTYGGRPRPPKQASDEFLASLRGFNRQALHAAKLSLHHPISGDWMSFEAPRPDDFVALIQSMKDDLEAHSHP
tara:strand:+ start:43 stop:1011 length:969 start_codon:yes stop_codon:yes gene_type:complete